MGSSPGAAPGSTAATTLLSGQDGVFGLAADGSHRYWTNFVSNCTIKQANLDGTGVTTLATGQNEPRGVAVGPQ